MDNVALVADLVEWVAAAPRPYAEVMSAWRTSCPRLTIWEDALDAGLLERTGPTVSVTARGLEFLRTHSRAPGGAVGAGDVGSGVGSAGARR